MDIREIYDDNVSEYSSIIDPDVAENMERMYYRGLACHDDDDSVKARLQNYVFIELFVDDKRDGIGDKNSAIQREQFGSNAQPYFVQLDAKGNQVAVPMAFTTDPNEFIEWLKY